MFISWHSAVRKTFLFLLSLLFYMQTDFYIIQWTTVHYCHIYFDVCIIHLDRYSYSKWLFLTFDITHFFFKDFLPFWHVHTHLVLILFQHWNQLFPQSLALIGKLYLATKISELKCIVLQYWSNCLWATLEERTR